MNNILCIFAHPDDEAFGPSGTIALLSKTHEVSILCITNGSNGENHTKLDRHLSEIRRDELKKSAAILGVKKIYFLDYNDGELCNKIYHTLAKDIEVVINKTRPDTLITFEYRGFLGHIDHITVTMVSSFLFEKKDHIRKMMYFCISEENRAAQADYFIFIPPGYKESEIDVVYDISAVWKQKIASMQAHASQKQDYARFFHMINNSKKEEYFLVKEK